MWYYRKYYTLRQKFTLPSLRHLPKECSFLQREENRCLPEDATHSAETKLPPCCCCFRISLSLSDSSAVQHVRYTPEARQGESRFQCAQLYNSYADLNSVLTLTYLACLLLNTPPVLGEGMSCYFKDKCLFWCNCTETKCYK